MLRWSQIFRWHFRYTATIELTHNPTGDSKDAKRLAHELETGIRQIQLMTGYRVARVKVEFDPQPDDVHMEP